MLTNEAVQLKSPAPKPSKSAVIERERMSEWLDEHVKAGAKSPVIEKVALSPALATLLLERNPINRKISSVLVDRIVSDIEGGRWEFNGETVVVSKDGLLNDGQHRAQAVIKSGRTVPVVMVFGPSRESRMTLDTGTARSVPNFLHMNGYHDTNNIAAVANIIHGIRAGITSAAGASGRNHATKTEMLVLAEKYADSISNSLNFADRKGAAKIASKSVLAFVHWAIADAIGPKGVSAADGFLLKLIEGDNLSKSSPILVARNKLLDMRQAGVRGWPPRIEVLFKAWNAVHEGKDAPRIWVSGHIPELEV